MSIGTRTTIPAKLRRSGIARELGRRLTNPMAQMSRSCRSYGAWLDFRMVVTIGMALLTELVGSFSAHAEPRLQDSTIQRFNTADSLAASA